MVVVADVVVDLDGFSPAREGQAPPLQVQGVAVIVGSSQSVSSTRVVMLQSGRRELMAEQ